MGEKISFYFDEHLSRKVAAGLEARGYQVIMAVDVNMVDKDDLTEHLRYATENTMVMVTCDRPFAGRAASQSDHSGLICWTGVLDDFGGQVRILNEFAEQHTLQEVQGQVYWLKA